MSRLLIFGGTTEGRLLCRALAERAMPALVCVATDYGRDMLAGLDGSISVHVGPLDAQEMEALMRAEPFRCVIDATHPFAALASRNIRAAAEGQRIPYYRLSRASQETAAQDAIGVLSISEAAAYLRETQGNILATTGAKELDAYTVIPAYEQRVYPRVLPSEASIARCLQLGFRRDHIIAMQGPFSQALNRAMMEQLHIRWLVTKESGGLGGFMAKIDAAADCGARAIVIGRPEDDGGYTLEAILRLVSRRNEEEGWA